MIRISSGTSPTQDRFLTTLIRNKDLIRKAQKLTASLISTRKRAPKQFRIKKIKRWGTKHTSPTYPCTVPSLRIKYSQDNLVTGIGMPPTLTKLSSLARIQTTTCSWMTTHTSLTSYWSPRRVLRNLRNMTLSTSRASATRRGLSRRHLEIASQTRAWPTGAVFSSMEITSLKEW